MDETVFESCASEKVSVLDIRGDSCRNGNTRDAGILKILNCNVYHFVNIYKKILWQYVTVVG